MVETRRSSASTKRPLSSPTTSDGKRSKAALETTAEAPVESNELGSEAKEIENRLVDPMVTDELKVSDGSDTLMVVEKDGYDVDKDEALSSLLVTKGEGVEAEKAMKSDTKVNRVPTRTAKSGTKVWGKLLSQCSQNPHLLIRGSPFSEGHGVFTLTIKSRLLICAGTEEK